MMRKLSFLILSMIALFAPCETTARNEHLEPVKMKRYPEGDRYYDKVFSLLHSGFSTTPPACYTVLPSHAPEYAWSLEHADTDAPILIVNTLSQNFWYTRNEAITTRHVAVTRQLAAAIVELFHIATGQIKKAEENPRILDGVTYHFAAAGTDGIVGKGRTHSPGKASLMWRLVAVCEEIGRLGGESAGNETGIAEEIASLIHDLRLDKTMTNSIGLEMVLIPPGSFTIWHEDTTAGLPVTSPLHHVIVSRPFYLGKYEVTQKQWVAVMESNPSHFMPGRFQLPTELLTAYKDEDEFWEHIGSSNLPVEQVSWNDVQEFIKRLNAKEGHNRYRLPTEMEWEYAALGGTDVGFFNEDQEKMGDYAWFSGNAFDSTRPVGQLKPNQYGLYDIYGNVKEWVQDWFGELPTSREISDYRGPATGLERVYRGCSHRDHPRFCRPDQRNSSLRFPPVTPDYRSNGIGFRLALSLE